jgi:hypothetical protein
VANSVSGMVRPSALAVLRLMTSSNLVGACTGRSPAGIEFNDYIEEDGTTVFRHACAMGLEGIVSKRVTAPYRSGPSRDWLKIKNPDSPAMIRARDHFARLRE